MFGVKRHHILIIAALVSLGLRCGSSFSVRRHDERGLRMCADSPSELQPKPSSKPFGLIDAPDLKPRYNIAPTQQIAAIRLDPETGTRQLSMFRWGLVPCLG